MSSRSPHVSQRLSLSTSFVFGPYDTAFSQLIDPWHPHYSFLSNPFRHISGVLSNQVSAVKLKPNVSSATNYLMPQKDLSIGGAAANLFSSFLCQTGSTVFFGRIPCRRRISQLPMKSYLLRPLWYRALQEYFQVDKFLQGHGAVQLRELYRWSRISEIHFAKELWTSRRTCIPLPPRPYKPFAGTCWLCGPRKWLRVPFSTQFVYTPHLVEACNEPPSPLKCLQRSVTRPYETLEPRYVLDC